MINDDNGIKPRAMSRTELARLYNVHISTIANWINDHSAKIGCIERRLLTPKQVKTFFECVGYP